MTSVNNTVDKIYELIKQDNTRKTFNDNIELFQEFYYRNMSIKYNGLKVIEIYKYLLSLNISEDHETMPYINSNIYEDFNNYIMYVTQSFYSNEKEISDDDVDILYKLIEEYNIFEKYSNQGLLTKIQNKNIFIRNYTASMMVILNSSFFDLSNENIMKMVNTIKNNEYLKSIIENGKVDNKILDKDYIMQYTSRYLFNMEFMNVDNISNDELINAIKSGKITDKSTLEIMFKNINVYFLLHVFDGSISSVVDMLENTFTNEIDRLDLFNIICGKIISDRNLSLIVDFIIKDERSNNYIPETKKKTIINNYILYYPVNPTKEEIEFILSQEEQSIFLFNLIENSKDMDLDDETKALLAEKAKTLPNYEYDLEGAIKILDSLFKGKKRGITILMVFGALKTLIKDYLKDDDIRVYITCDNTIYGCTSENYIKLNYTYIKKLLETVDYEDEPKSIHILNTIFHESRHVIQFRSMEEDNMDEEIYTQYKEDVARNVLINYYKENYVGVAFEKDARIEGARCLVELLKKYFPYMEECIKYYEEMMQKEYEVDIEEKRIFELSKKYPLDEIIEKLLTVNPEIVSKYKGLECEYNLDGTKKSKEGIIK